MAVASLRGGGCRRSDPRPYRAPQEMGMGHHGTRVNSLVRIGKNLRGAGVGAKHIPLAVGASHAERVPALGTLERIVRFQQHQQHLI